MNDVKTHFQNKIKELQQIQQSLDQNYPEMHNNQYYTKILTAIKQQKLNKIDCDFNPTSDNLDQIDQAARFFNIDYDLQATSTKQFVSELITFHVIFDLTKLYNTEKAIKQRHPFLKLNSQKINHVMDRAFVLGALGTILIILAIIFFSMAIINVFDLPIMGMTNTKCWILSILLFVISIGCLAYNYYLIDKIRDQTKES